MRSLEMIDWVKRKVDGGTLQFTRAFSQQGVLVVKGSAALAQSHAETAKPLSESDMGDLLHQLEDDGFALPDANGWVIPWESVYNLIDHSDYKTSLPLLQLPPVKSYAPSLRSDNSLTDERFAISIANWRDDSGRLSSPIGALDGKTI